MTLTPEIFELIKKAEGDYTVAGRELAVLDSPVYDVVCFHVQQCLEKYLKALLAAKDQSLPKTHDLEQLLYLVMPHYPHLTAYIDEAAWILLAEISGGAVEVRYPGVETTIDDAQSFYDAGQLLRQWFRDCLGLQS